MPFWLMTMEMMRGEVGIGNCRQLVNRGGDQDPEAYSACITVYFRIDPCQSLQAKPSVSAPPVCSVYGDRSYRSFAAIALPPARDILKMSDSTEQLIHYLSLSRTCTPEQSAELVLTATADPNLHRYGELLASPLQSLQTTHPQHYNLLRLFAHGTVTDYKSSTNEFPPLTPAHWTKLRILTLLTVAHSKNTLHYKDLLPALAISSVHELESVIIEAVYRRLIRARIHQSTRTVAVAWAVGRDVTPDSVSHMRESLTAWLERSTSLIREIEARMGYIRRETAVARNAREKAKIDAENVRQQIIARR